MTEETQTRTPSTRRLTPALWKSTCRKVNAHIADPLDLTRCMYCNAIIEPEGYDK